MKTKVKENPNVNGPEIPVRDGVRISRISALNMLGIVLKRHFELAKRERIKNPETFRLKLNAGHIFSRIAASYGVLLKDVELRDLIGRIEALEAIEEEKRNEKTQ